MTDYTAGQYKPKRDYSSSKFVSDQVKQMTRQHEIVIDVISNWSGKLKMTDWGWLGAFFLKIKNPYVVDQEKSSRASSFAEIVNWARKEGHDGVVILNTFDPKPTDVYIVFEPEQIRSINAAFDPLKRDQPALMA